MPAAVADLASSSSADLKRLLAPLRRAWTDPEWGDRTLYPWRSVSREWPIPLETDSQLEIRKAIREHRHVSVRSAHAMGKTGDILPKTAIDYLLGHFPSYVVVTSSDWATLEDTFWTGIRELARGVRKALPILQRPMTREWWPLGKGIKWAILLANPDEVENIAGRHNDNVMAIVDEASALSPELSNAIDGILTRPGDRRLDGGNPLYPSGPFYDQHHGPAAGTCKTFRLSAYDSPNIIAGAQLIPGMASREWLEKKEKEWEPGTAEHSARLLGEFPTEGQMTVITRTMIEAAVKRYDEGAAIKGRKVAGIDTGITTDGDPTVGLCRDDGRACDSFETATDDPEALLLTTRRWLDQCKPDAIYIDAQGAPLLPGQLQALGYPVTAIRFGSEAHDPKVYVDQRAEMYFTMRAALRHHGFAIEPDVGRKIASQAGVMRVATSDGRNRIEPKEKLKERIGRSPDHLDALALTFVEPPGELVFGDMVQSPALRMTNEPTVFYRPSMDPDVAGRWIMQPGELTLFAQPGALVRSAFYSPALGAWCLWAHLADSGLWTVFDAWRMDAGGSIQRFAQTVWGRSQSARPGGEGAVLHGYGFDLFTCSQDVGEIRVYDSFTQYRDEMTLAAQQWRQDAPTPTLIAPGLLAGSAGMERIERLMLGALMHFPDDPYWRGKESELLALRGGASDRYDMLKVGRGAVAVLKDLEESRAKVKQANERTTETLVEGGGGFTMCLRALAVTSAGRPSIADRATAWPEAR